MPSTVTIGNLRERVEIQQDTPSRDAVGGFSPAWTTLTTVWARVAPMGVGERYMRNQMQANASWRVTVRHRSDLSPQMRVVWGDRTFEVRGVTNADERDRFLDLACDELSVVGAEVTQGKPIGLLLALTHAG